MKTQKTKSAFISAIIFRIYFLSQKIDNLFDEILCNEFALLICVVILFLPCIIFSNLGLISLLSLLPLVYIFNNSILKMIKK